MKILGATQKTSKAYFLLLAGMGLFIFILFTPQLALTSELQIHHINVQQGDSSLIIGPNGTTLLIDAGQPGKGNNEVVPYLQSIGMMPFNGLDYIVNTHRDDDHLGGLDEVLNAGYKVRKKIWDNGSKKKGLQITQFLNAAKKAGRSVKKAPLGKVVQLGDGATATIVAVHGRVLGFGAISGVTDENDLSVAILVKYKDFEYLTAGDLGGGQFPADNSCTGRNTTQKNIESALAMSLMQGKRAPRLGVTGVEVIKVSHHGSESSTNYQYMNLMTPKVAVINVGAGQGAAFHHPRKDVVENVLLAQGPCITAPPALVLQTEDGPQGTPNTSFAGFAVGDVIIKTTGIGAFTVSGTGAVSQGPDERAAAGISPSASFSMD